MGRKKTKEKAKTAKLAEEMEVQRSEERVAGCRHDHYPEWDPMKGVAESLLNQGGGDIAKIVGGVGTVNVKLDEILCPFNDGKGKCYKSACQYKHVPYSSQTLQELPKLHSASVLSQETTSTVAASLPPQILPADGCISKVAIVSAISPESFYVIPENGWRCLCSIHENGIDLDSDDWQGEDTDAGTVRNQPRNFFDCLENIQTSLNKQSISSIADQQRSDFNPGDLVAVKALGSDGKNSWYRAKVVGEVAACDDDIFKSVDVPMQLIDHGVHCVKSSLDITVLPSNFCRVPPLAYKCQLYGVSPILGSWSSMAIEMFKELVLNRCVIAEVVRTARPSFYNCCTNSSDDRCSINLYTKSNYNSGDQASYIDITQHLINSGYGLEWNLFPEHPAMNNTIPGRVNKFALS